MTQPTARGVAALQMLDACKEGALSGLFPVLMLGVIGTSSAFMGIVNSAFAVTALLAGPTIAFTVRRFGYRLPIATGTAVSGALLLALSLHPTPAAALGVFALSGYPFTIAWVAANTMLILHTTENFRARAVGGINSLYSITMLTSAGLAVSAADHLGCSQGSQHRRAPSREPCRRFCSTRDEKRRSRRQGSPATCRSCECLSGAGDESGHCGQLLG